jgi:lipid A 4'-phosphatase
LSLRPGPILALGALLLLAATIIFPGIDLAIAGLAYVPGQGFPLARLPVFTFIMVALPDLVIGGTVVASLLGLVAAIRGRTVVGIDPRIALFLATSLALGPGLVVNTLLKDHWGRARPHQIADFGGGAHFSPAVLMADQCARNCSFPSGHAALGFWLVAVALVTPTRWRTPALIVTLAIGGLVGLMRIAQGAHFFSDVLTAALITVGINYLLKWLILDRHTVFSH